MSVALSGSGDLAALDGTTVALSTEGFDPQLGDRFDVLRASTLTDTGFSVVLPELGEGLGWVFGIVDGASEDALRFEVVPEPGAAGLLLVGLLLLARSGRPIA